MKTTQNGTEQNFIEKGSDRAVIIEELPNRSVLGLNIYSLQMWVYLGVQYCFLDCFLNHKA